MGKRITQKQAYQNGYYKAVIAILESNLTDSAAAQKILNIRILVRRLPEYKDSEDPVKDFETELLSIWKANKWNLTPEFFSGIEDLAKGTIVAQVKKETGIAQNPITDSEYIESCLWLETAYDIRSWADFDNAYEAFDALRVICRSSPKSMEYIQKRLDYYQKLIWDEKGLVFKLSKSAVKTREDGDYSSETIELWQRAFALLASEAFGLMLMAAKFSEFVDIPHNLIEDGKPT